MWTLVGLGNPIREYRYTRHNTGEQILSLFREKHASDFSEWKNDTVSHSLMSVGEYEKELVRLVLPQTYMNNSGETLRILQQQSEGDKNMAEKLVVLYDDIDLPLGVTRLSFDRGSGGHWGLESVVSHLNTREFLRVRIGIAQVSFLGNIKKPRGDVAVQKYILSTFSKKEKDVLEGVVYEKIEATFKTLFLKGVMEAMRVCNTK